MKDIVNNNGWIDCNERLPDEECMIFQNKYGDDEQFEVIVMIANAKFPTTLYYDLFSGNFFDECECSYTVTHWMPLPDFHK